MFASIDMTEGTRVRRKSNQFDFPTAKGEVEPLRRYSGGEELMLQRASGPSRKSPIMAVSDDYYSHIAYASRPEDSVEMSMKTIEMLALIKGTSPEQIHLQAEMVRRQASEDGQTSTEGSSAHHTTSSPSEEFELDFDDDYLLGDSFIGFTEDGNLGESSDEELVAIERGIRNVHIPHCPHYPHHNHGPVVEDEEADSYSEEEPEDEIFEFEL